jgi:hypothetical protein
MDATFLICIFVATLASCSAIAGCIAYHKRRSPVEGMLLGFFLGPVGVLLECWYRYVQRPPVDENAWNSLRSMMTYQENDREGARRRSASAD